MRAKRAYDLGEVVAWLEVFLQRFFGFSQFKRSAIPNGPKVSAAGALSPRRRLAGAERWDGGGLVGGAAGGGADSGQVAVRCYAACASAFPANRLHWRIWR